MQQFFITLKGEYSMSEQLKIIYHFRRLKSAVKELSVEQLKDIKEKLQTIIDERTGKEALERQENQERLEKIKKYRELLAADGIDPNELTENILPKKEKYSPREPKYEVWDDYGKRITWTGQGRMPNIFKARMETGEPIETFLIE